jgi:hypothetical protein
MDIDTRVILSYGSILIFFKSFLNPVFSYVRESEGTSFADNIKRMGLRYCDDRDFLGRSVRTRLCGSDAGLDS